MYYKIKTKDETTFFITALIDGRKKVFKRKKMRKIKKNKNNKLTIKR